jgi:hypothetical protein
MNFLHTIKTLMSFQARKQNWISEREAAQRLFRNPTSLRRLARSGDLPVSYKSIKGRFYKYNEADILRYMSRHTVYRNDA